MSVSIALLPVALAMRIVMGKEGFENWVRAQEIRVPTSFENEQELSRVVKKAGYDAVKFGSLIKTHLDGEKAFFFWEFVDGKWVALFSKNHDRAIIKKFISSVVSVAGGKVFDEIVIDTEAAESARFPTNFRDGEMLLDALKDFGAHPVRKSDGSISCQIGQSNLLFSQTGDSPFMVEVKNSPSLEQVYRYMSDIDEDYKRCVQTAVYEKVKARALDRDMLVEQEEVLQDKTILMTLRVS